MDIGSARLLLDVARHRAFTKVARDRGLDPSRISRMVAAIEDELGFRIFQRTTRRVSITEAGELYLNRIASALDEMEQARDDALSLIEEASGTLRMTASVAFAERVIVPLIPAFRTAYPKVHLDLILSDSNLDLVQDGIDLAVRLGPSVSGDLVITKLMDTIYRVCAAPAYCNRTGTITRPADISDRDCLLFNLPGYRSRWLFQRAETEEVEEVKVNGSVLASNALALYRLALSGMGPALLADWLVDGDIADNNLVDLFPDFRVTATRFDTAVWLLYPSRSFLPRKVRVMIDFLKANLPHAGRRP